MHTQVTEKTKNSVMNGKNKQQNQGKPKINALIGMTDLRKTLYFKYFSELHLSVIINCNLSGSLPVILQILDLTADT